MTLVLIILLVLLLVGSHYPYRQGMFDNSPYGVLVLLLLIIIILSLVGGPYFGWWARW